MDLTSVEADSRCWCFTGTKTESAIVYLLNQIAGGTMTVAEVEENSKCWCLTGVTYQRAVVYLLAQIAAGGSGGGGDPIDTQALDGLAPVTSTKNMVLDSDTGFLWYSSTKAAPWTNL